MKIEKYVKSFLDRSFPAKLRLTVAARSAPGTTHRTPWGDVRVDAGGGLSGAGDAVVAWQIRSGKCKIYPIITSAKLVKNEYVFT